MTDYRHLIAFDLSSYGVGFALINRFVDGDDVREFELSPCGTGAQLILLSKEVLPLQFIEKESLALFGSQILNCKLVSNLNEKLLPAYLAQNKVKITGSVLILEGNSVAQALATAQQLLSSGADVVDFRVLRTFPKNVVLTASGPTEVLMAHGCHEDFKQTFIEKPEASFRGFFELP